VVVPGPGFCQGSASHLAVADPASIGGRGKTHKLRGDSEPVPGRELGLGTIGHVVVPTPARS
jgi:hypothetical protein